MARKISAAMLLTVLFLCISSVGAQSSSPWENCSYEDLVAYNDYLQEYGRIFEAMLRDGKANDRENAAFIRYANEGMVFSTASCEAISSTYLVSLVGAYSFSTGSLAPKGSETAQVALDFSGALFETLTNVTNLVQSLVGG